VAEACLPEERRQGTATFVIQHSKLVTTMKVLFFALLMLVMAATGCYYDKEEVLYPATACDTTNITFSRSVVPLLSAHCTGCHGGSTPSAAIRLDTYSGVRQQADNGRLLGSVNHTAGFSPMPKGATKLSACNITKLTKWVAAGAPNN
jgi:cytochrome c553